MFEAADTQTVTASDGRTLAFAEWGEKDGFPVFFLHGTPGSRFNRHHDESVYVEVGARVITYDRPGYGRSDRCRRRRVVDCAADVAAIADALGIDRFAVTGGSSGGPHSLAVAACLPERVSRAACTAGVAPFDPPDFDWFAGMDAINVREMDWALEGEDVLARELEREAAGMLERLEADPSTLLGEDVQLAESDRAQLAQTEGHEVMRQTLREAFRHGVWGYVDDTFSLTWPWGFDLTDIRVPTRVIYGLADVLVPQQHGAWLARNVPDAEVVVDEQAGHFTDPALLTERLGWLVTP
jgi:pimeloyl-ACP methyl ester carboxylesterase